MRKGLVSLKNSYPLLLLVFKMNTFENKKLPPNNKNLYFCGRNNLMSLSIELNILIFIFI